jgi:hypothetical protein
MSKNVIILGAGTSAGFGAPVMSNFLDVAMELYSKNLCGNHKNSFERVFKAISKLQAVHSKSEMDLHNIESIFTSFELAKTISKMPGVAEGEIDQLIEDLKLVICSTLQHTIKFPVTEHGIIRPPEEISIFINAIIDRDRIQGNLDTSVITFNYDILLEMGLLGTGVGVDYEIAKEEAKSEKLPILKLHGSLNWTTDLENDEIIPWFVSNYAERIDRLNLMHHRSVSVPIGEQLHKMPTPTGRKIDGKPVIVPPSWNKSDHHRTISKVWTRAAKELSDASSIYIIGYSLPETDSFFRQLYALGTVGETMLKRFWVFNPDRSRENVFRSMLGPGARDRYRYFDLKFSDAISVVKDGLNELEPKAIKTAW